MKSLETSDGVEEQLDKYRRTPGPVELEDGGGAVMAAIEVDDGVNDGPDASALFVHIATEDLRDVDRCKTHAKGKRADSCEEGHSKHSPGADAAVRGQSLRISVSVGSAPVQVWQGRRQSPAPMWYGRGDPDPSAC